MLSFKQYIKEQNTVGKHNDGPGGSYLNSDWTGSETFPTTTPHLASTDLSIPSKIPTIKITSKIRVVDKNKNPIFIQLQNGTRLYLTLDEFNRISGTAETGKTLTVVFQRSQKDKSNNTSQIQSISIS